MTLLRRVLAAVAAMAAVLLLGTSAAWAAGPHSDSFTYGNYSDLPAPWVNWGGTYLAVSGVSHAFGAAGGTRVVDLGAADGQITATIVGCTGAGDGLVLRGVSAASLLVWRCKDGALVRRVSGADTVLATGTAPAAGTVVTVAARATGVTVRTAGGAVLLDSAAAPPLAGTFYGITGSGDGTGRYDDYAQVLAPPAPTPTPVATTSPPAPSPTPAPTTAPTAAPTVAPTTAPTTAPTAAPSSTSTATTAPAAPACTSSAPCVMAPATVEPTTLAALAMPGVVAVLLSTAQLVAQLRR